MKPYKSVVWKRCSVPEPGRAVEAEDAEDVPYVLLYFTVSHSAQLHYTFCMSSLHGIDLLILLFSRDRPIVQGITRWLPATPAKTRALPHEGALALEMVLTSTSACCGCLT